jgi:hypothetical protein
VQIATLLGTGVQFASVDPGAGGACTSPTFGGTGTITCTWAGATAVGAARSVSVTAYSYNRGSAQASASASSATSDPTPDNNAVSATILVGSISGDAAPVLIPTADRSVLVLLMLLLGMAGVVAVRQRH